LGDRIGFLTRLVGLKLAAFLTFILLALYTPSTTNTLLGNAGSASKLVAQVLESALQSLGGLLGDASILMPKKGAAELMLYLAGMDKVLLFIAITITLYLAWLLLLTGGRGTIRAIAGSRNPRAQAAARLHSDPPR
jgi:hypothetical protein